MGKAIMFLFTAGSESVATRVQIRREWLRFELRSFGTPPSIVLNPPSCEPRRMVTRSIDGQDQLVQPLPSPGEVGNKNFGEVYTRRRIRPWPESYIVLCYRAKMLRNKQSRSAPYMVTL